MDAMLSETDLLVLPKALLKRVSLYYKLQSSMDDKLHQLASGVWVAVGV